MHKVIVILLILIITQNLSAVIKYKTQCYDELLHFSREIAYQQVGISNNDTMIITKYLASVGLNYPNPYCAAGQYYCFREAARMIGRKIFCLPSTGSAQIMFHKSKANGLITKYLAEIDDLIFWRYPNSWKGHVERVIVTGSAGWVITIGFNTKKGNFRGVNILKRNIYYPLYRMQVLGIIGFERN